MNPRTFQLIGAGLIVAGLAGVVWWWRTRKTVTDAVTTENNPDPHTKDGELQPALNLPGIVKAGLSKIGQIGATFHAEPVASHGGTRPLIPNSEP